MSPRTRNPFQTTIVLVIIALLAGYGLHALAQGRVDTRTPITSLGNSSSNGVAFAWFFDASERTVYVCRAGQSPGDGVDCRAKAALQ